MAQRLGRILGGLLGAFSCGWLAFLFFRTWQNPLSVSGGGWVRYGFGIMVIEFILVHSGAMLASLADPETPITLNGVTLSGERKQQAQRSVLVFLSVAYILMGLSIALAVKATGLLLIFLGIMASRWLGFFLDSATVRAEQLNRSKVSASLYLLVVTLTVFVPFPAGGLTPEVLGQVYPNRGTGVWAEHPERVFAAGMIYFVGMGVADLLLPFFAKAKPARIQD